VLNAGVFAFLVTWGEFLTGVSLTFGTEVGKNLLEESGNVVGEGGGSFRMLARQALEPLAHTGGALFQVVDRVQGRDHLEQRPAIEIGAHHENVERFLQIVVVAEATERLRRGNAHVR